MDGISMAISNNILPVIILVIGFVLVVVEMYIPGFGVPGITGGILLVIGIWLVGQNALQRLLIALIIIVLLCIILSICIHSASKGRLSKSKLVNNAVAVQKEELEDNDLSYFVGKVGVARTVLRPAGMAEFDNVKLNVVSDGEFIGIGRAVKVVRVEGNRIVVIQMGDAPVEEA